jgi:hypothetical protein
MHTPNARRAHAADASSGSDRPDKLFTEAASPPVAIDNNDASLQSAQFRVAAARRGDPGRLIDLERRARFGRFGFGAA